jgi:heptaprenyl diphosphate synthase
MAFQIIDDILDYTKQSGDIGKPVLEDMRQGVYSLPLIYSLQHEKEKLLPYLMKKADMTNEDVETVQEIVNTSGGVAYAKKLAAEYTEKALKDLAKLPENTSGTRENLITLTKQILDRGKLKTNDLTRFLIEYAKTLRKFFSMSFFFAFF